MGEVPRTLLRYRSNVTKPDVAHFSVADCYHREEAYQAWRLSGLVKGLVHRPARLGGEKKEYKSWKVHSFN